MAKINSPIMNNTVAFYRGNEQEECYGHKCLACESTQTVVIDKTSRRGWLVKCQECGSFYYVEAQKK
jgi:hypothetical protein